MYASKTWAENWEMACCLNMQKTVLCVLYSRLYSLVSFYFIFFVYGLYWFLFSPICFLFWHLWNKDGRKLHGLLFSCRWRTVRRSFSVAGCARRAPSLSVRRPTDVATVRVSLRIICVLFSYWSRSNTTAVVVVYRTTVDVNVHVAIGLF